MTTMRAGAALTGSIILTAATFFMICTSSLALAQDANRQPTNEDFLRRRARDLAMRDRIRALTRATEIVPDPKVVERRQMEEWLNQLKQDFVRIQVINNSMRAASVSSAVDYKLVSDLAGEMRKRAQRLITNLALPGIEEKSETEQQTLPEAGVKALSDLLDARVVSFVSSPLFKEMTAVDVEMATNASRDLSDIMSLSERIKGVARSRLKADRKQK